MQSALKVTYRDPLKYLADNIGNINIGNADRVLTIIHANIITETSERHSRYNSKRICLFSVKWRLNKKVRDKEVNQSAELQKDVEIGLLLIQYFIISPRIC